MGGGRPQEGQGRAAGLPAAIAAAIEASLAARLRAEGRDPLSREGAAARDRHRRLLEAAEDAVGRFEDGASRR